MHLSCPFVVALASLFAVVEASSAMGYELIFFYEAYKIDFLVNGAGRQLGLSCGKKNGNSFVTTELATFNEFADCNLDRRGRTVRTYSGGADGDTTTPDVEKVAPKVKEWGFISQDPRKLVATWGGATQNDDTLGHGEVTRRTTDILWDAKETDPSKVSSQDLANINACMKQSINIRWMENKQGFLKDLEKQIPKWATKFGFPPDQIQPNKIVQDGIEVVNVDAPLISNGASAEVQWQVSGELPGFTEKANTKTIKHEKALKMIYNAWMSLGLQHCV
ncbi:hypothetical protein IFR05_009902 [Cadophora sp. M221]|nr:hypothetical protein IFR05_009902 [Cadophora sp. M221]